MSLIAWVNRQVQIKRNKRLLERNKTKQTGNSHDVSVVANGLKAYSNYQFVRFEMSKTNGTIHQQTGQNNQIIKLNYLIV